MKCDRLPRNGQDKVVLEGIEHLFASGADALRCALELGPGKELLDHRHFGEVEHVAAEGRNAGNHVLERLPDSLRAPCHNVVLGHIDPLRQDALAAVPVAH